MRNQKTIHLRKTLIFSLKLSITILIIYFLFRNTDITLMKQSLKNVSLPFYLLALLIYGAPQQLSIVFRWRSILQYKGICIPVQKLIKYHYISLVFQMFLPAGVGADASKAFLTFHYEKKTKTINSLILARATGLWTMSFFAFIGSLFVSFPHEEWVRLFLLVALLSGPAGWFIFSRKKTFSLLSKFRLLSRFPRLRNLLLNMQSSLDPVIARKLIGYSTLIFISMVLATYFLCLCLQIKTPFFKVLTLAPLIQILTIIIPSVNGIGPREFFWFFFFQEELITKERLGLFSLCNYSIIITVSRPFILGSLSNHK